MTNLPKTQFISLQRQATNYSRNRGKGKHQKFIYQFVHRLKYKLRNKLVSALAKVNFDLWKKKFFHQIVDILFNSIIIGFVIVCWRTGNPWLLGISITLFLIVLKSYVEEYFNLFKR